MVFTSFAVRRNSPRSKRPSTSRAMLCDRSPFATPPITRDISFEGCTRSLIRLLMESIQAFQPFELEPRVARWVSLPSLPTTRLIRSNSLDRLSFSSKISFNVSAILPATPTRSVGMRNEKSPFRNPERTFNSSRESNVAGTVEAAFMPELLHQVVSSVHKNGDRTSKGTCSPYSDDVREKLYA